MTARSACDLVPAIATTFFLGSAQRASLAGAAPQQAATLLPIMILVPLVIPG
jgi:hypothetical protein